MCKKDETKDTEIVDIYHYVSFNEQFVEDYETAITSGLLKNPSPFTKHVLGTLFNKFVDKLKEARERITTYKDLILNNTISVEQRENNKIIEKQINQLGFQNLDDVAKITNATPTDEEYKFVYSAVLYCIASRQVRVVFSKITDLFPLELIKDIHSVLTSPGTIRNSGLYRQLTYNVFALHIIKFATARWKYFTHVPDITKNDERLLFEGVHIHDYIPHDIASINTLSYYERSRLFYITLDPATYKNGDTLYNALTDLSTEYRK
jgi:hypothetical protein